MECTPPIIMTFMNLALIENLFQGGRHPTLFLDQLTGLVMMNMGCISHHILNSTCFLTRTQRRYLYQIALIK